MFQRAAIVLACVMATGCADAFLPTLIDPAAPKADAGAVADTGAASRLDAAPANPYADAGEVDAEPDAAVVGDDAETDAGTEPDVVTPPVDSGPVCTGAPLTGWKEDTSLECDAVDDGQCPACAPHGYACVSPTSYPGTINPALAMLVTPPGQTVPRVCSPEAACVRGSQADSLCPSSTPHGYYCGSAAANKPYPGCVDQTSKSQNLYCCP